MQTHRIVIDEEEFEEEDMALKPIKERLEMVDVDIKYEKKRIEDWNADCCKWKGWFSILIERILLCVYLKYVDMSRLDTSIVVHTLSLIDVCKPEKQKLWRIRTKILIKVKEKVKKQWDAGFLVVKYPQWVSNIAVVPNKGSKIHV